MSSSTSFASAPQPQLVGQRARLQRELVLAFSAQPLSHSLIERIVDDLATVEDALADDRWQPSHDLTMIRH